MGGSDPENRTKLVLESIMNIKEFNDKPIIAWEILAAQKSVLFDCIVVSIRNTLTVVV